MPNSVTPRDLQVLSNAILDGSMSTDNLPKNAQAALTQYWSSQGVSSGADIDSQQSQQQINQLISQRRAQEGGSGLSSVLNSPIFKPLEWAGSKAYWLYSNTVAPAISAMAIGLHGDIYGDQDKINNWSAGSFGKLWNEAHNVSPGQSIWMLGMNNKQLNANGIDPAQIVNQKKQVMAGTFQGAKTKADPLGNIPDYQAYFSQGAAKYVTGATDFAISWYADPTVLAGKVGKIGKAVAFTKPVNKIIGDTGDFDKLVQGSTFQKMVNTTWDIKQADPDTAAFTMRNNLKFISNSANGDAFTRLLDQAKNRDEISNVLRIVTGDETAKATLDATNAQLGMQIDQLNRSRSLIGANYHGLPPAAQNTLVGQTIKQHLDDLTSQIAHANNEQNILTDKLNVYNTMDNLNFNRVTSPLAVRLGQSGLADTLSATRPLTGVGKIQAVGNLAYNASIAMPMKIIRSYSDLKPTMHIDIHDEDSYKQLDSSLRESKTIDRTTRETYVSNYLKAKPEERGQALIDMEHDATQNIVRKFNEGKQPDEQLTAEDATQIYKDFAARRKNMQAGAAGGRSYGNASVPDPSNPGMTVRVGEVSPDGTVVLPSPIFDTQLANNHVIMDFGTMEKAINANGSSWSKMSRTFGKGWTGTAAVAGSLNSIWQFAQLARFGYGPRALSDDFLGQLSRFGAAQMINRTIQGGKIKAQDFYRTHWAMDDVDAARTNAAGLQQKLTELGPQETEAKNALLIGKAKNDPDLPRLQSKLEDVQNEIVKTRQDHLEASKLAVAGQQTRDVQVGRQVFSGPMAGQEGDLFRDLTAGGRKISAIMGSSADWYLKKMRALDWENITPATHGADKHMDAWVRVLNDQVAKSPLGRQALMGKSEAEITRWLKSDPEGIATKSALGTTKTPEHIARDAHAETDYLADPNVPGMDVIRQQLLDGKLDRNLLDETVKAPNRPAVQAERSRYAFTESPVGKLLDFSMTGFYHFMSEVPANKLLRNPLFGQQYKASLNTVLRRMEAQGVTHVDEATRVRMENTARRLALRDVKNFTFSVDNETKMSHAMKNYGAFFGAQQENWNRWSRIIADDPSVLAHVTQAYQAPLRAGIVVDANGNPVDASGYSTDPLTGQKTLTSFADRSMVVQIPSYLGGRAFNKFIGLDPDASFKIPMSTVNIILNKGDGALPVGAGPYVQIAANHFAQQDPAIADYMQKLGVLPFGAQKSVWDFINPATGKRLGDSVDETGETKQQMLWYMMQVEDYKYQNGMRKTAPTWTELNDRANHFAAFRTISAFALPISLNAQDPYQFYRDEFKRLQQIDPDTANQKFYDKYGDSAYLFTQSLSKNNAGLQPTVNSVKMSKYYQDLISKVGPQYAGLIVGSEGGGSFSNGAYQYEQTHIAAPGTNVTERSTMSARDALSASQVNLGWMQYGKQMDTINAQLFARGLKSYDDPGAEDLKALRQGTIQMLTSAKLPDGSDNPYYNEDWDKAYNTLSPTKYERTAVDLQKVVDDPEIMSKAYDPKTGTVGIRSDLYTLKAYLDQRTNMQIALNERKFAGGSSDINAQSNYDLKNSFATFTTALIEADTKFSDLHSRYFANDMGYNENTTISSSQQAQLQQAGASLEGSTDPGQAMLDALMNGASGGNQ